MQNGDSGTSSPVERTRINNKHNVKHESSSNSALQDYEEQAMKLIPLVQNIHQELGWGPISKFT